MTDRERHHLIREDAIAEIINMINGMTTTDKTADDFQTEVMANLLMMYKAESEDKT